MLKFRFAILSIVAAGVVSSCTSTRQAEMEAVAKDWAVTIRASQVMPVYPLSEDLEPGDVFLVTNTIQAQRNDWNNKGFIPLPQHIVRLRSLELKDFYNGAYGTDLDGRFPETWRFPSGETTVNRKPWERTPKAFFPSYYFETKSGAGFSVAFPVYGIPVGLSLLGTSHATGSVAIQDAYTYGVTLEELRPAIREWSEALRNTTYLAGLKAQSNRGPLYLRVINRVFLASSVSIALTDASSLGGGADVGAPKDVPLGFESTNGAADKYTAVVEALNKQLNQTMPGGSLRFSHATRRGVVAEETFERPLVIGYHAFDFEVYEDGSLSEPVSVLDHIENRAAPHGSLVGPSDVQRENGIWIAAYGSPDLQAEAEGFFRRVAELVGGDFLNNYHTAFTNQLPKDRTPTDLEKGRAAIAAFSTALHDTITVTDLDRKINLAMKRAIK